MDPVHSWKALLSVLGSQEAGSARRHNYGSPTAPQGVPSQVTPTAATPYFTPAASGAQLATAVTPVDAWHSIISTLNKSATGHGQSPAGRKPIGSPGASSQGSSPSTVRQQLFQTDVKGVKAGCTRFKAQTSRVGPAFSNAEPTLQPNKTSAAASPQHTPSASPTTQQLAQRLERLRASAESTHGQHVSSSNKGSSSIALMTAQRLHAAGVGGLGSSSKRLATPLSRRLFSTPSKQASTAQATMPMLLDAAASPVQGLSHRVDAAVHQQEAVFQQHTTSQQQSQLASVVGQMQELLLAVQQQQAAVLSNHQQPGSGSQVDHVNKLNQLVQQGAAALRPEKQQEKVAERLKLGITAHAAVEHTPAPLQVAAPTAAEVLKQQEAMLQSLLQQQQLLQQEQQLQEHHRLISTATSTQDQDQPQSHTTDQASRPLAEGLSEHVAKAAGSSSNDTGAAPDMKLSCSSAIGELSDGNRPDSTAESNDEQPHNTALKAAANVPEATGGMVNAKPPAGCSDDQSQQEAPSSPNSSKPPLWCAESGSPDRTSKGKKQQQSTSTIGAPAVGMSSTGSSSPRPVWRPSSASPSTQASPGSSPRSGLAKQGSYTQRYMQQRSLKEEAARALSAKGVVGIGSAVTERPTVHADVSAVDVQQVETATATADGRESSLQGKGQRLSCMSREVDIGNAAEPGIPAVMVGCITDSTGEHTDSVQAKGAGAEHKPAGCLDDAQAHCTGTSAVSEGSAAQEVVPLVFCDHTGSSETLQRGTDNAEPAPVALQPLRIAPAAEAAGNPLSGSSGSKVNSSSNRRQDGTNKPNLQDESVISSTPDSRIPVLLWNDRPPVDLQQQHGSAINTAGLTPKARYPILSPLDSTSPSTPPAALPRIHTPGKDAAAAAAETVTPMLANSAAAVINLTEAWREESQDTNKRWKQLLDEWSAEELPLQNSDSANNLLLNSSSSMLVPAEHAAGSSSSLAVVQSTSAGAERPAVEGSADDTRRIQQESEEMMLQQRPQEEAADTTTEAAISRSPVQQMRDLVFSPGSAFESEASELSLMAFKPAGRQQPASDDVPNKGPGGSPARQLFLEAVTPVQQLGTATEEGKVQLQQHGYQSTVEYQQHTEASLLGVALTQHVQVAGAMNTEESFNQLLVGIREVQDQLARQQQQQQQQQDVLLGNTHQPSEFNEQAQQQQSSLAMISKAEQPAVQVTAATGCNDSSSKHLINSASEGVTSRSAAGNAAVQAGMTLSLSQPSASQAADDSFDQLLGSLQELHDRLEAERQQQQQGALNQAANALLNTEDSFNQLLVSLKDVHDRLAAERQHRELKQRCRMRQEMMSHRLQQDIGVTSAANTSNLSLGLSGDVSAPDAHSAAALKAYKQGDAAAMVCLDASKHKLPGTSPSTTAAAAAANDVEQELVHSKQMSAADKRFMELRQRLQESRAALQAITLPAAPPASSHAAILPPTAATTITGSAHHSPAPQAAAAATAMDASSSPLALPASAWLKISPLQQYLKHSRLQQGKPAAALAVATASSDSKPQGSARVQALVAKWRAEFAAEARSESTAQPAVGATSDTSPLLQQRRVHECWSTPVTTGSVDTGNRAGANMTSAGQCDATAVVHSTPWQQPQQQFQQASDALGLSPLSPLHTLSRTGAFGLPNATAATADAEANAVNLGPSENPGAAVTPAPPAGVWGATGSRYTSSVAPAAAAGGGIGAAPSSSPLYDNLFPMSPLLSSSTGMHPGTGSAATASTTEYTPQQSASNALVLAASVGKGAMGCHRSGSHNATPTSRSGSGQLSQYATSNSPPSVNMLQQWVRRGSPTKSTYQQLRSRAWQEQQKQQMQVQQQQVRQQLDSMQQAVTRLEQHRSPVATPWQQMVSTSVLQKQQQPYDTVNAAVDQDGFHSMMSISGTPEWNSQLSLSSRDGQALAGSPAQILAAAAAEAEETAAALAADAASMANPRPDSPKSRIKQLRFQQAADQHQGGWALLDKTVVVQPIAGSTAASAAAAAASAAGHSSQLLLMPTVNGAGRSGTWLQSAALRRQQQAGVSNEAAAGHRVSNSMTPTGAGADYNLRARSQLHSLT